MHILNEKSLMINNLIDIEIVCKMLLGAHLKFFETHPLDYVYNSLNTRFLTLDKHHPEYEVIMEYITRSYTSKQKIQNIFAIERKGEAERISKWKGESNKMLLWHGSKITNFMGILAKGLKVAPPEAPATGYMFGKGIYLSDMFTKALNYCEDWQMDQQTKFKLMILSEVVLGNMYERLQAEFIKKLPGNYLSTKGVGQKGPDFSENIVLSNGAILPFGKIIQYK